MVAIRTAPILGDDGWHTTPYLNEIPLYQVFSVINGFYVQIIGSAKEKNLEVFRKNTTFVALLQNCPNMKRVFLFLALALFGAMTLRANPVDPSLAQRAASKLFETQFAVELRGPLNMAYAEPHGAYYVFTTGEKGFVIIAGDDAYRPVIGYSTESTFDPNDIPPALTDYLDGIAQSILSLQAHGQAVAVPQVAAEWESVLNHGRLVSRFGGRERTYFCQTQWNQDYPYNYCCPDDPNGSGGHAIVGCLATAMSQLMRFWASPIQGIGNHCYVHEDYGEICADFGNTTYDWDHMPNKLNSNASEEEKLAVGTLCFHCGVTIDMGYGPDGSGGASGPIPGVMHQYFDYSEANVQRSRNDYETETWKRMVREQFDMGWPMYYGGCQDGGCHAFVCDGYDDADMFHFNLGWGGGSDGWYLIDEAPYTHPADAMFNFVPSAVYDITPSAPTDFSVDVPVNTELHTILHWTNPTTSLDNSPLASIEEVVVMRNNQVIQVLTGMTPGQTVEIEDDDVPYYDTYEYAVYAKANGRYGKHAYALDVKIGPSCQWKVVMTSSDYHGWNGGYLSFYNNAGHKVAQCTMSSSSPAIERPELPLGRVSFGWTPSEDTISSMGFVIRDADNQEVFSFSGSSADLGQGVFFEVNNSCGGDQSCGAPENLTCVAEDEGVMLSWEPVANEGYGYNIYRDGQLIRLIPAGTATSYLDGQATLGGYCYKVTVLCDGGENGESNESCASMGPCWAPSNFDFEITPDLKVRLSWDTPEPGEGLTGYYLYRKRGDGEYKRIKLLGPNYTTYTDIGLQEEDHYYYRLYAYYRVPDCYSAPASLKYNPNSFELHAYYSPTGLDDEDTEVKVYPNPTNGMVRVEAQGMTHVTMFNTLGQCVLDQALTGNVFEWHDMAKGLFLIRIDTDNGVYYTKIVVL